MADDKDQPQSESLAGWMRRWLRLPTVGLPDAKALLAAEEERRRALRQQLSDAIPERLKSLAGMATDYLGQQFTPSPEMTEVGTQLKAMTNGGPVYGPMARFGVDQFVDSTTPGGAAMNLDLPVGKILGGVAGLGLIKGGLKVVEDVPRGLYSRVDEALKLIPAKGAHPNKVASLLKSNASAEELAYRQVPEFLAAKGNATVTPAELAAHLAAHPAPMPVVKTLGEPRPAPTPTPVDTTHWAVTQGPNERWKVTDTATGEIQGYVFHGDPGSGGARTAAEAQDIVRDRITVNEREAAAKVGRPRYAQYQVPGGENYRETLSTLPQQPNNPYEAFVSQMERKYGEGYDTDVLTPDERTMQSMLWERSQRGPGAITEGQFRSGHWEEPNVLVHTRSNERTLPTGEPGRFVEEVQSDWHQQGKQKGYQPGDYEGMQQDLQRRLTDVKRQYIALGEGDTAQHRALLAQEFALVDEWNALHDRQRYGAPDAPFKEAWPDLGLKQQVLEAANDPNAQWIGHTSGQTQAARYDLSKQIDELKWYRDGDGYRISAKKDGSIVAQKSAMSPEELSATVGKEMAEKIVANTEQHGAMSGLDLKVGGEGMQHFYDNLLPKRLEKILKPFGGTVERGGLTLPPPLDAPVVQGTEPAWIARLTPEMKARIRREGLPLLSLLGMGALWQAPTERPENRQ